MVNSIADCLNNDLVRQFMCATRLTSININQLSNDVVSYILMMLSHPLLKKYPPKTTYLVKFVKTIIKQMENIGNMENELIGDLYLKYVELIQKGSNERFFYKHYILENSDVNDLTDSVIIIQESTSIVSQGTTGLCTWQAGVALSCWCLKNKDKLKNKFIVELGCGAGLSGINACINCKPCEYWFTDCHSAVLDVLKHNLKINEEHHKFSCKYDIKQISWDNIDDFKVFDEKKPDLVVAADVVFDQTMFEPLCNSLKYFITNNTTEILLFCTIRNLQTYKQFLKTLEKYKMNFTQDLLPDNYSILLAQDCPLYIVNIKQNVTCLM